MINKSKILEIIEVKGKITSSELIQVFRVSRQYTNRILQSLVKDKSILKIGTTKNVFYVTKSFAELHSQDFPSSFHKKYLNKNLEEHKILAEIEDKFFQLSELSDNVRSIFTFGFSEMFNNAIEHSESKYISVEVAIRGEKLSFIIEDAGIGAFRNIQKKRKLNSEVEAIQDLLKGKTTTMPKSHSGEGIFFTSKAADVFILHSFNYQLIVEANKNGTQIKQVHIQKRGTGVIFEISIHSELHLTDVFRKYTNLSGESDHGFDMTEIRVKLFTMAGIHISRSQARRILSGLEKFKIILLDFDNVSLVGQAFADEIYRVFKNAHPNIQVREENMNEAVRFMVERARGEAANKNLEN